MNTLQDNTAHLPAELLLAILERLPHGRLLLAAQVSRRWRAIANRSPECYHFLRFIFPTNHAIKRYDVDITRLSCAIAHAERAQTKLGLAIRVRADADPLTDELKDDVLPVLRRACPVLARLDLCVDQLDQLDADIVLDAFAAPAPQLYTLRLDLTNLGDRHPHMSLFAGNAPVLTEVSLPSLPAAWAIPRDAPVRTLALETLDLGDMAQLDAHYPLLAHLSSPKVASHGPTRELRISFPSRLRTLCIGNCMHRIPEDIFVMLAAIPRLSLLELASHNDAEYFLPALQTPGLLSMQLAYGRAFIDKWRPLRIALCSDAGVRRAYCIGREGLGRLLDGCADRVTRLRVDDCLLESISILCRAFPALRHLHVDLTGWLAPFEPAHLAQPVRCAALVTLELQSTDDGVCITDRELVRIAAYFLRDGPRPVLVLSNGLRLAADVDGARLEREFAGVRYERPEFDANDPATMRRRDVRDLRACYESAEPSAGVRVRMGLNLMAQLE